MRPLRHSINISLDGCCDHRAIPADEELHRYAVENLDREHFAVVDDAISAGSSTRATVDELDSHGAQTVVVGALLLLGDRGERHFVERSIPVVAAAREKLPLWDPQRCPLCQAGVAVGRRQ